MNKGTINFVPFVVTGVVPLITIFALLTNLSNRSKIEDVKGEIYANK